MPANAREPTPMGGMSWTEQKVTASDGFGGDGFGIAVDGAGDTYVTGRSPGGVNETSAELDIVTIKYASEP